MGTTPNGLPYPEGTDLVVDGDNAIQALADAIKVVSGMVVMPSSTTTDSVVAVTFPAGLFTVAPIVVTSSNSLNVISANDVPGTGGVTVRVRNVNAGTIGSNIRVFWIATKLEA